MLCSPSPKILGSIPSHHPRNKTPDPHSSLLPGGTPDPYPSSIPSDVSTRTPSPHPPYTFSRPSSPHSYTVTGAPSLSSPNVPDHQPSCHSPALSDSTLSRHPLCSTPSLFPPYYRATVVINHPNQVSDGIPVRLETNRFDEMQISIQEDFCGIEMGHHRADLIRRLDHVLERLNRGVRYFSQHNPAFDQDNLRRMKDIYQKLRETLLRVDAEVEVLGRVAGSHTTFMCALPLPCP